MPMVRAVIDSLERPAMVVGWHPYGRSRARKHTVKKVIRVILSLAWVGILSWAGGAIGVAIARQGETPNASLPVAVAEMVVRQDHFLVGVGVGLAASVLVLVLFFLLTKEKRASARPGTPQAQ